jgi:hypothetical protein
MAGFETDGLKKGAFGGVKSVQRSNELLLGDLKKMQSGDLGLSDAEKQQQISNQTDTAGRAVGANQMALGQLAAANPFAAGQLQSAARQGSQQVAQAGAQAAQNVDQLSAQMAQQQAEQIRQQLEQQRERRRENTQFAVQTALEIPKSAAAAASVLKDFEII